MFFGVLSLFENPVERPKRTRPLHKKKIPNFWNINVRVFRTLRKHIFRVEFCRKVPEAKR